MKEVQKLMLITASFIFVYACNSNQPKSDIHLNKGEKWQVNSEMKPHIQLGNELVNDFVSGQDQDYLKLAENLKAQNNALIQSCTMKGASHDELHKWLLPHMKVIEELASAKDASEAASVVAKIQISFDNYNKYFQ